MGRLCPDKVRFRDRIGAEMALLRVQAKDRDAKRAYRRPFCRGWHLTSQDQRT